MCSSDLPSFFFFNDTATTEIYTLSLHDALPIWILEIAPHAESPSFQVLSNEDVPSFIFSTLFDYSPVHYFGGTSFPYSIYGLSYNSKVVSIKNDHFFKTITGQHRIWNYCSYKWRSKSYSSKMNVTIREKFVNFLFCYTAYI